MAYELKHLISSVMQPSDDWKLKLIQDWPAFVGGLHMRMRVERIVHDVVVIGVYDQHWMHELFHMSRMIMQTINQKFGYPHVRQLRFVLAQRPERKDARAIAREPEPVCTQRALTTHEQRALSVVKDPELQELLKALVQRVDQVQAARRMGNR